MRSVAGLTPASGQDTQEQRLHLNSITLEFAFQAGIAMRCSSIQVYREGGILLESSSDMKPAILSVPQNR